MHLAADTCSVFSVCRESPPHGMRSCKGRAVALPLRQHRVVAAPAPGVGVPWLCREHLSIMFVHSSARKGQVGGYETSAQGCDTWYLAHTSLTRHLVTTPETHICAAFGPFVSGPTWSHKGRVASLVTLEPSCNHAACALAHAVLCLGYASEACLIILVTGGGAGQHAWLHICVHVRA